MHRDDFGPDFTWGVASAAWQIEGAWDADGKTPSIWDHAGHHHKVKGGPVGDVAIDFAHRYPEDLDLIASLGFDASRISLSWPRLIPSGTGALEPRGVEFYERILDASRARGVEPWVTIYHWDLPRSLHERGGWSNRDSVEWFADYAEAVARALGDRITKWMIANEPSMHALHHLIGCFDHTPSLTRYARVGHHQTLAIAEAARRIRAVLGPDAVIGTTHQCMPVWPDEGLDGWAERGRRAYEAVLNGMFLDPLGGLGYPWGDAPLVDRALRSVVRDGDEDLATHHFDFLGVQYYQPLVLTRAPIPGLWALPIPPLRPPKGLAPVKTGVGLARATRGPGQGAPPLRRITPSPTGWSSPRTAPRSTTCWCTTPTAHHASTTRCAPGTTACTWPRSRRRSPTVCRSTATSRGRTPTTSSGRLAASPGSVWSTSTTRTTSGGSRRTRRCGSSGSSPATPSDAEAGPVPETVGPSGSA